MSRQTDPENTYSAERVQRRFEATLRAALNTPPKPLKSMAPKGAKAQRKKPKRLRPLLPLKALPSPAQKSQGLRTECRLHEADGCRGACVSDRPNTYWDGAPPFCCGTLV